MKKLNVTIKLEMSVPDDWMLVETSEGTPVLALAREEAALLSARFRYRA